MSISATTAGSIKQNAAAASDQANSTVHRDETKSSSIKEPVKERVRCGADRAFADLVRFVEKHPEGQAKFNDFMDDIFPQEFREAMIQRILDGASSPSPHIEKARERTYVPDAEDML